ncbi:MAG: hypothetical protein ACOCPZ_00670 [Natrialbaceae archaeon]
MSTPAAQVSNWSRRFTLASVGFALAWGFCAVAGLSRRAEVSLALFGFVFHAVFGRGYALIPTYFDRSVHPPWLPALQFPLSVGGAALLAVDGELGVSTLRSAGATLWLAGAAVFVGGLLWSVRTNLTGAETATGEHNSHRRRVDRFANLFVPVVFAYLLAGSYELLAGAAGLPALLGGYPPRATHVLAVGSATLLVFAVGFRLFPRFLRTTPPTWLVAVVLPLGAVSPAGLAATLPAGDWFPAFAVGQAGAVLGYAAAMAVMFRRAEGPRIGMYGVLAGAALGVVGIGLGLWFAFGGLAPELFVAHARVNLLGFLGLSILGATYQFYPPSVSQYPGGDDRTAAVSITAVAAGLLVQTGGAAHGVGWGVLAGEVLALVGITLFAVIVVGAISSR